MGIVLFAQVKNKTVFCLLIIILFTTFFYTRSVVVRERWIVPTFLNNSLHQNGTGAQLAFVNNWLREGIFNLRFCLYTYPASVETPTLDKRGFYGSVLPGSSLQIYLLFKILDLTGIVPDIYEKRSTQLLLIIFYNHLLHFLLALTLCMTVFFVCRRMGFDNFNSMFIGVVPAVIQFNNANSLYWHHIPYYYHIIVVLPFAIYGFMELMRIIRSSSRIPITIHILQPLVMFCGILTDWFFVLVALTVYIMRIIRKEIDLPSSWVQGLRWMKQSFLFFSPILVAIVFWISQLVYYSSNIAQRNFFDTKISAHGFTLIENVLHRIGIADGQILSYLSNSLFTHIQYGFGNSGVVVLYAVFYIATRVWWLKPTGANNLAAATYFLFFIPCLAVTVILANHYGVHKFSAIIFSPALSLSFAFAPIFILQIMKKNYLLSVSFFINKNVSLAAIFALIVSVLYGFIQTYNSTPITKMFSPPDYHRMLVGNFVRQNTTYRDVVFSNDHYFPPNRPPNLTGVQIHFPNKIIHHAQSLEQIYQKTKDIETSFTVKLLILKGGDINANRLSQFFNSNGLAVSRISDENIGMLLSINGQQFISRYNNDFKTWLQNKHAPRSR